MRRQGLGVAEIGAFVGALYLPWAFKWAYGPIVDVLGSARFGRRRTWIVLAQTMMIATLLVALPVDFTADAKLFTALVIVLNVFSATQDVATDALAVAAIPERERGVANGFMFAGQYLGQAVGGSGALFLTPYVGFRATFLFVAAALALVTALVSLRLREPRGEPGPEPDGPRLAAAGRSVLAFVRDAARAFFGSRAAFFGLVYGALPAGAFALSLALQSNLAVELGLGDRAIATLGFLTTVVAALACVAGGWTSDRLGRRRTLAAYVALTAIPTLWLAWAMARAGWIMPVDVKGARPVPPDALVATFWAATLVHAAFHGMMFGTRTALFMDITTPRVAATQFTAYMALLNLVTSASARWQGASLARWGYPVTLAIDSAVGLLGLAVLPLVAPRRSAPSAQGLRADVRGSLPQAKSARFTSPSDR
jgi:PAT family beta-lactamase induction signal transducer AmpG